MYRVTWLWGNGWNCPCCRVEKPMFEDFDTEKEALRHAAELVAAGLMDEDFADVQVFKGVGVSLETDEFYAMVNAEMKGIFKDMEDGPDKEAERRKYTAMCESEDEDEQEEV